MTSRIPVRQKVLLYVASFLDFRAHSVESCAFSYDGKLILKAAAAHSFIRSFRCTVTNWYTPSRSVLNRSTIDLFLKCFMFTSKASRRSVTSIRRFRSGLWQFLRARPIWWISSVASSLSIYFKNSCAQTTWASPQWWSGPSTSTHIVFVYPVAHLGIWTKLQGCSLYHLCTANLSVLMCCLTVFTHLQLFGEISKVGYLAPAVLGI